MELQRQHIVIRERTFVDLIDLTLKVVRLHALPLFFSLIAGCAPFALVNAWLLHGLLAYEGTTIAGGVFHPFVFFWGALESFAWNLPYLSFLVLLAVLEAPLATSLVTLYLGHWTFSGSPKRGEILEAWAETLPQCLLFNGLLRPLFLFHGYLPEIILLERTPLRGKSGKAISTLRRNRALHWDEKSRIFVQRLLWLVLAGIFITCWYTVLLFGFVLLTGDPRIPQWFVPLSMAVLIWILIGVGAVLRFLCYMNVRIRHEGWEVELAMRVERGRLTGPTT